MSDNSNTSSVTTASAAVKCRKAGNEVTSRSCGIVGAKAYDAEGNLKWEVEGMHNIITNAGLNHKRDVVLLSGTQITSWYIGLTDGSPTVAAGDTAASHAGWVEVTAYSEGTRQAWTGASVGTGQASNTASVASYSINGTTTVGGLFLIGGTGSSTKGGSTGTLYSVVALSGGDRALQNGDTLEITYALTDQDDGA